MAVVTYKCPNCGGELLFDADSQQFVCEYCNSQFAEKEIQTEAEADTVQEQTDASGETDALVYQCPSCGAELVTDATTAATFCYYCHNPVALSGRLSGEYLPDKLIPFSISREKAEEEFRKWIGKRKFVPSAFYNKKQIEKLTGVYFPYWSVDVEAEGSMQGEASNQRTWVTGDFLYTETKDYRIRRKGKLSFQDISKNALQKANRELIEGVLPYRTEEAIDFSMPHLAGFYAEKRDMEREMLEAEVQADTETYAGALLRETVKGYSSQRMNPPVLSGVKKHWDYMLLPVWTITYKGAGGKIFYYAMNGQTGKICGELPVDKKKLALLYGGIVVGVTILGMIGGFSYENQ